MRFYTILGVLMAIAIVLAFIFAPGDEQAPQNEHCKANEEDAQYCCIPRKKAGCLLKVTFRVEKQKWRTHQKEMPYSSFRLDTGDLNMDGTADCFLGLEPSDSAESRQIAIYLVEPEGFQKFWQGKTQRKLYDFRVLRMASGDCLVRTISHDQNNRFCVGEYRLMGESLQFMRFLHRHLSLAEAQELLLKAPKS